MPQDRVCGENEKAEEKSSFYFEDGSSIKYERGEKLNTYKS